MSLLMSPNQRADSDRDEPLAPSAEKESLSPRMLELIETATVEERRRSSDGGAPESGESRRRSDQPSKPVKRAS